MSHVAAVSQRVRGDVVAEPSISHDRAKRPYALDGLAVPFDDK